MPWGGGSQSHSPMHSSRVLELALCIPREPERVCAFVKLKQTATPMALSRVLSQKVERWA